VKKGLTIYCVVQWGWCDYQVDFFNKMQDYKYKNRKLTEVAKILKTDISEIKTVMIDLKSVAVITEEFCILYCVIS
jgi:hypothetical protein